MMRLIILSGFKIFIPSVASSNVLFIIFATIINTVYKIINSILKSVVSNRSSKMSLDYNLREDTEKRYRGAQKENGRCEMGANESVFELG